MQSVKTRIQTTDRFHQHYDNRLCPKHLGKPDPRCMTAVLHGWCDPRTSSFRKDPVHPCTQTHWIFKWLHFTVRYAQPYTIVCLRGTMHGIHVHHARWLWEHTEMRVHCGAVAAWRAVGGRTDARAAVTHKIRLIHSMVFVCVCSENALYHSGLQHSLCSAWDGNGFFCLFVCFPPTHTYTVHFLNKIKTKQMHRTSIFDISCAHILYRMD